MDGIRILPAGEKGIVVEFGNCIDAGINGIVHRTVQLLKEEMSKEIIEIIPTYRSLLIYFDPLQHKRLAMTKRIEELVSTVAHSKETRMEANIVYVPVCYGDEFGPDLHFVAEHNGLSAEEVIAIHTSTPYLVYMLGFTPGFPYLGGMSERIAAPRLAQPRKSIPEGSVGIAGSQTGVYPIESPGGWQLIGRTPVRIFHPQKENPFLFDAGDYLQFMSISPEEYHTIKQEAADGRYTPAVGRLHGGSTS